MSGLRGTDFRGTFGNVLSGAIEAASPGSCVADLLNTGYTGDEDDYPYQASCSHSGGTNSISCFPAGATVVSPTGVIDISEITYGTLVATGYNAEKSGYVFEPVLFFLHAENKPVPQAWVTLYWNETVSKGTTTASTTTTDFNNRGRHTKNQITLSPLHLIFICEESTCCKMKTAISVKQGEYIYLSSSLLNNTVNPVSGYDCGFGKEDNNIAGLCKVRISLVKHTNPYEAFVEGIDGLYAPATKSGSLLVDNVYVSTFSVPQLLPTGLHHISHDIFRRLLTPVALITSLAPTLMGPWLSLAFDTLRYIGQISLLVPDYCIYPSQSFKAP